MPDQPQPRTLAIDVIVTGQQAADGSFPSLSVLYETIASVPPTAGLVDASGNFALDNIPANGPGGRSDPAYTMAVDTTFTLKSTITDRHGQPVTAVWAYPVDQYGLFVLNPSGKAPDPLHIKRVRISDSQVFLHNGNFHGNMSKAGRTYQYGLGIFLPEFNNEFISLDPTVLKSGPPG